MRVGLLYPGEMGAAIGDLLVARGHDVSWAAAGRSAATRERASALTEVADVAAVVRERPDRLGVPSRRRTRGRERGRRGWLFWGVRRRERHLAEHGARHRLGRHKRGRDVRRRRHRRRPAPARGANTRLYLAGDGALAVAELFEDTPLQAIVLDGDPGAASALKVCYAAYTKGTTALLLAIRSLAQAEGVDDALLAEWATSQPELVGRSEAGPRGSARKAWRFAGEMDEIADAFAAAGVPDGFHRAAGDVYRRLGRFKDASEPPSLAELVDDVRRDPDD